MPSPYNINDYVNTVCEQIRWKKARQRVSLELTNHLLDGRDSYIAQGLDETAAIQQSITDTGDAAAIGAQLDRIHRPKPQWGMLSATAALLMIGLLVRMFIYNDEDRIGLFSIRLFYTGLGIVGMFAAYYTDFTLFCKYPKIMYLGIVSLSIASLLFSPKVCGVSFYTRYLTLLFPLAFAAFVFAMRNKGYKGLLLCEIAFVLPGLVVLAVPSLASLLYYAVAGIAILCAAIYKSWFGVKKLCGLIIILVPLFCLWFVILIGLNAHYFGNRLAIAFDPSLDPQGEGYMGVMTRQLLSGARWVGKGIIPKEYSTSLSEPAFNFYSDSLITAMISLLGWISFFIILGALLFFIVKGFILCFKQKSSLGFFVSFAVMLTIVMQVIGYVVYNLGFQLIAPISLPLISYGNTAMIINLVLIGFMLSVFRTGDVVLDGNAPPLPKPYKRFFWDNGRLTIDLKAKLR